MGGRKKSKPTKKAGRGPEKSTRPRTSTEAGPSDSSREPPQSLSSCQLIERLAAGKCTPLEKGQVQRLYHDEDTCVEFKEQLFRQEVYYRTKVQGKYETLRLRAEIGHLEFRDKLVMIPGFARDFFPQAQRIQPKPKKLTDRQKELLLHVPSRECSEQDDADFENEWKMNQVFREELFRREAQLYMEEKDDELRMVRVHIGWVEFRDLFILLSDEDKVHTEFLHDLYSIAWHDLPSIPVQNAKRGLSASDLSQWVGKLSLKTTREAARRLATPDSRMPIRGSKYALTPRHAQGVSCPSRSNMAKGPDPPQWGVEQGKSSTSRSTSGERSTPARTRSGVASVQARGSTSTSPSGRREKSNTVRESSGEASIQALGELSIASSARRPGSNPARNGSGEASVQVPRKPSTTPSGRGERSSPARKTPSPPQQRGRECGAPPRGSSPA